MPKESLLSSMPKLILAVVLIVCVGAVMGLMGYALTKKQTRVEVPEVKTTDEIVKDETVDWQTYRNEEFGFEIKYPEEWNIYEDYRFPIFGIYKDEKGSFRNNNISIAPRGIGTNAEPGKRQIIENPTQEIGKAVQLITKGGNPYSYNISFDDYPVSWGDDGFILANAETKNRKTECITDKGIQCSNFDEESEFTVLEANVNSEDWITIDQILSTFKFIEKI